jgi:hypothetical protein
METNMTGLNTHGTDSVPEDDRRFEIALRLMGREVIAVALFSSSPSAKWLWMSLGAVVTVVIGFAIYGSNISEIYRNFLPGL